MDTTERLRDRVSLIPFDGALGVLSLQCTHHNKESLRVIEPQGYVSLVLNRLGGREGDVETVMSRALDYGIDPVVSSWLGEGWMSLKMELLAQALWRRQKLFELLDRMPGADVLLLKGEAIAQRIFGDAAMRRCGDVDLLVRWDDVIGWGEALRALGYRSMYAEVPQPWLYDQWAFVHPETAMVIELHWAIAPPPIPVPSFETLWEDSQEIMLGDRVIRALSDGHTLIHLCYHFHHHAGFLKGLVDIAAWCDRFGCDRDAIASAQTLSKALGVEAMVHWPLRVLSRLGGVEVVDVEGSMWSEVAAWWTFGALEHALALRTEIGQGSSLAFKTQGVMQAQVVLWQMAGFGAVDDRRAQLRLLTFPIWRDPWVMAMSRGAAHVELRDFLEVVLRPLMMMRKSVLGSASAGDSRVN